MVDYVMCVEPQHDPADAAAVDKAIRAFRTSLADQVVNHTSFPALRSRPIAVSIETKRRGRGQDVAELQIGTWHAAQWSFLARHSGDGLRHLAFLPAVVVQGHQWCFAASTYDDSGKTVRYTPLGFCVHSRSPRQTSAA